MSLSGGNTFSGIFIQSGKILSAKSLSGMSWDKQAKEYIADGEKPFDIGLEIEVDTKQSFSQKIAITGRFKNTSDEDWTSSAWNVKIFLDNMRIGKYSINSDRIIPQEILDKLIGLEVTYLRYPYEQDGKKKKYRTYRNVILSSYKNKKHNQGAEAYIKAKFNEDVAAGYIKDYISDDTSFPGPEATQEPADTGQF
jgi:hypothetical protein